MLMVIIQSSWNAVITKLFSYACTDASIRQCYPNGEKFALGQDTKILKMHFKQF